MSSRGSSGASGTQDGADAVGDAPQRVGQTLARLQEALRQQKQEAERKVQEAERRMQEVLRLQEEQLREMDRKPMTSRSGSGASGTQDGADAVGDALQRLQEAMRQQKVLEAKRRMQEALCQRRQEAERRMQEILRLQEERLREMDRKMQEKVHAVRSLQQRLQETHVRMTALEERTAAPEGSAGEGLQHLEGRVNEGEFSLQSAFMPRVEALLRTLEEPQFTRATVANAAASARQEPASSGTAAGGGEEPPFSTSIPTPSGAAADEEERPRRRVELRVREVELRCQRARSSPSLQGEQLCAAAEDGSLSDVQRLIDSGADVNYIDQRGLTPLLRAALRAHADMVSLFLQRGASVNAVGVYGNSALHMAALSRGCVELLVRAGADVNARNIDGETPLHWAAQSNNEEAVRALHAAGARRDLKPWGGGWKGKTPIKTTTSPILEAPMTRGAAAGDEGERQRRRVGLRVHEAKIQMEEARTSPSPLGEQLCKAAKEGRLSGVRRLLDSGADINYIDRNCSTPLDHAVWKTHVDVVSLLLQRGADVNAVDRVGCSALHLAAMRDRSGQCVELLVRAGAEVNARDQYGHSPLHYAAERNNEEAVRALLAAGARRDLKSWGGEFKGKTPFETTTSPIIQDLLRL